MRRYFEACIGLVQRSRTVTAGVAIVIVAVVAIFLAYRGDRPVAGAARSDAVTSQIGETAMGAMPRDVMADESGGFCDRALHRAKEYGTVPGDAALSDSGPVEPGADHKFNCSARADKAEYTVTVDQLCDNDTDSHCLRISRVAQDDGTVWFQRHD